MKPKKPHVHRWVFGLIDLIGSYSVYACCADMACDDELTEKQIERILNRYEREKGKKK